VDSISYIQLETTDESLFGLVNLIKYFNGKYYVFNIVAKGYFIFDETGKYLGKFNRYGQGPGEYISPNNFTVDSNGGLHVLDLGLKKILVYDSAHNFIKPIDLDIADWPRDLICFGNKYVLSMPDFNIGARQGLFIFDPENNTYTEITHPDEYVGYSNKATYFLPRYLAEGKNGFYTAVNEYNNIIYKMQFNQIVAKFRFGIDPPYNPRTQTGYRFVDWMESDNMFLIYWAHATESLATDYFRIVLFNQDTQAIKVFDKIQNDIDGREFLWKSDLYKDYENHIDILFGKTLNGKMVFICPGDPDEKYGEKNHKLMIWHLKKWENISFGQ
jgi:hypothetical protein